MALTSFLSLFSVMCFFGLGDDEPHDDPHSVIDCSVIDQIEIGLKMGCLKKIERIMPRVLLKNRNIIR